MMSNLKSWLQPLKKTTAASEVVQQATNIKCKNGADKRLIFVEAEAAASFRELNRPPREKKNDVEVNPRLRFVP